MAKKQQFDNQERALPEKPEDKIKLAFWFIKTCGSVEHAKKAIDAASAALDAYAKAGGK